MRKLLILAAALAASANANAAMCGRDTHCAALEMVWSLVDEGYSIPAAVNRATNRYKLDAAEVLELYRYANPRR
jgi:hypothetical protein